MTAVVLIGTVTIAAAADCDIAKDRQGEMSEYWVSIASYPYEDIPAIMAEDEFNRIFLELLIAMRGQDA